MKDWIACVGNFELILKLTDHLYVESNKKKKRRGTNELIYKTEVESQFRKQTYGYQGVRWGGINWKIGIDIHTLLYIK